MTAENMGQRAAREMREAEDRRWGKPGSGRNVNIDAFEPSIDTEDDRCAECDGKGELWNERRCGSCAGHGYLIHCAECTDRAVCNSTELTEDMRAKFCVSMRLANGSVTKRLVCGDSDCLGIVLRDLLLTATSVEKELARAQVEHDQQMRAAEANHRAAERSGLLEDAPTVITRAAMPYDMLGTNVDDAAGYACARPGCTRVLRASGRVCIADGGVFCTAACASIARAKRAGGAA